MITKLDKHDSHQVKIFQTRNNFLHSYALRCVDCDLHIQWLSVKDVKMLEQFGVSKEKQKYVSVEKVIL